MIIVLNACVESESDVQEYVDDVKKNAKTKLQPIKPPKPIKNIDYTAESLRSPFVLIGGSFVNAQKTLTGPHGEEIQQQPRPDLDRPREYLEQFPLSSLVMVGTLSKPNMNWGLVKDNSGMVHAVKVGDYMGQNSGQINAITHDHILLVELVPNGAGGWMKSRASLTLVAAAAAPKEPETGKGTKTPAITNSPAKPSVTTPNKATTPNATQTQQQTPQQAPRQTPSRGSTGGSSWSY